MSLDKNASKRVLHPLCMNPLRLWVRYLQLYGGVDREYFARAAAISALSLMTSPFRIAERALFKTRIDSTPIEHAPLFILGHWRTGTTFLHSLLDQDDALGHVSLFQTLAPASFFVGQRTLQPLVAMRTPETRPMDNVRLEMEGAQEEEFAMVHYSGHSFYNGWYFPRKMEQLFEKYALFDGLNEEDREEWRRAYLYVLRAATLRAKGKRLVLKNPVNTCRISALLDLFPDAKFVHICRDPYDVLKSSLHLYRSVLDLVSLQKIDDAQIEHNVLKFYRLMLGRYLEERHLIPEGNLVEVRYENLEKEPVREIERVYAELGIPGWESARGDIQAYAESQRTYKKNVYTLNAADREKVETHWKFALEAWGYSRPAESPADEFLMDTSTAH